MRRGLALLFLVVFGFCSNALLAEESSTQRPAPTQGLELNELDLWLTIIRDSIESYPRSCPCPYSETSWGLRCGSHSAWGRNAPLAPMCFPQDIPDETIARYRERLSQEQ